VSAARVACAFALVASSALADAEGAARAEGAAERDEKSADVASAGGEESADARESAEGKSVYVVEGVDIRGNERTLSRVIYALLPWAPGDKLDPEDRRLLRARYRLLATGYFRDVELSLRRGSRRGRVVLVVEVRERNTLVVDSLVAGVGARDRSDGRATPLGPFGGVEIAETNLGGTGVLFGAAAAIANDQHAMRLRLGERGLLATGLELEASFLAARHQEAFGAEGVRVATPAGTADVERAVYEYGRAGGSLAASARLDADWTVQGSYRVERLDAPSGPSFASELVDGERAPIELNLLRRASSLGVLGLAATYDSRDAAAVPSRGILARFTADVAATATGSDYPYAKLEGQLTRWLPLPWRGDVLRVRAQAGVVTGDAPLFERFYVGDLSDLLPDRVLGLTVDQRSAPNLLGTRIGANRWGTVAAKLGADYTFKIYRGGSSVESVDLYLGAGFYLLDDPAQLAAAARPRPDRTIPLDLTFDGGVRVVTNVGVFGFGISNWLGLFPTELRP
jgi:outer membrane protein insertion porin family